jgi:hypothetical protein
LVEAFHVCDLKYVGHGFPAPCEERSCAFQRAILLFSKVLSLCGGICYVEDLIAILVP